MTTTPPSVTNLTCPRSIHPLIVGLFAALPDPGQEFSAEDKETWLHTLDMNLAVIYQDKPQTKPPLPSKP